MVTKDGCAKSGPMGGGMKMAKKEFDGSWLILIILIIFCWPGALIYFLIHWDEGGAQETRTCLNCGVNIPIQYSICPYCGKSPIYRPQQNPQSQPNINEVRFCKNCGKGVTIDQDFCNNCGTKLK